MLEAEHLVYPCLRLVDAFPVQMDGQNLVCVRDPQALAGQPIFLNQALLFLVSRMDGKHSLRDIQSDFFRATSEILPIETLEDLVLQLDTQHYLNGPSFQSFYQSLVQAFREAPTRPARHAGTAYQSSRDALIAQMDSYFSHPDGPGNDRSPESTKPLRGIIAPHIDFVRGGPTYAHAYNALSRQATADTYIIFGTCHSPMQQRFSIGNKDYETPLGPARIDREFMARLRTRVDHEYQDEFPHRGEHSIEFQAVCLKFSHQDHRDFRIVPILVDSLHDIYLEGRTVAGDAEITRVVNALRETINETSGSICIIAAADLAHIGRRFGDLSGPTEQSLREVEREDRIFLKLVEEGDAEGIIRSIAADNNGRRICGYPPIYMTLRCIDKPEGKLLQYRQWSDMDEGAAVTYAAMAIY